MTRLEALTELAAKVEAGNLQDQLSGGMPMMTRLHEGLGSISIQGFSDGKAMDAYHGSLDAAKALHEAVLPGWAVASFQKWPGVDARVKLWGTHEERGGRWHDYTDGRVEAEDPTPARAWLLAILRALIEQETKE